MNSQPNARTTEASHGLYTFEWRERRCFGVQLPKITQEEVKAARGGNRHARDVLTMKLDVAAGRLVEHICKGHPALDLRTAEIIEMTMAPIRKQVETSIGHPSEHDAHPAGIWRCLEDPKDESIRVWAYLYTSGVRASQRVLSRDVLHRAHCASGDAIEQLADKHTRPDIHCGSEYDEEEAVDQLTMSDSWLAWLSQEEREVVVMKYWRKMKLTDIAKIKNVSAATIRSQHHRALGKIRDFLNQAGD